VEVLLNRGGEIDPARFFSSKMREFEYYLGYQVGGRLHILRSPCIVQSDGKHILVRQ